MTGNPRTPQRNEDAFLKQIADSTRNFLDLPSVYPFNAERYRLKVNGSRTDPENTTSFEDRQRDFRIAPSAGERVAFYTAERPRYVVGYEAAGSWAFEGLTSVSTNDTVRVGLTDFDATGNGVNRAYFEFTADGQRCVLERGGTIVDSAPFEYPDGYDFQSFVRPEIQYNAYDAGRWLYSLSYTRSDNGVGEKQEVAGVGELAVDQAGATNAYNFNLFYEVDSPDGATELSAGSMAYRVLGDTEPTLRVKGNRMTDLSYGGSGDYEAIAAFRKDPDRQNIYLELSQLSAFFQSGSGEVVVVAVDPSETDASGFGTPVQHSAENSVFEVTESVSTFPDSTGSVVSSAANPGGYQIAEAQFEQSGTGTNARSVVEPINRKRPIHNGDIAVVLAIEDAANAVNINLNINTEQDF